MLNKFHKNLLNKVNTLSNHSYDCVISSYNFNSTKESLKKLKIPFTAYPFTNSFFVRTSYENLLSISELNSVEFLSGTTKVSTTINKSKQFINIEKLTENKYFGSGITVAFIDTGISPHIDFLLPQNRIIEFVDLVNYQTLPYDDNGHGTFVASVCGGSGKRTVEHFSGIAPNINIVSIKALDKKGETDSNKILEAMQYVYDNADRLNIRIVCMSFGADSLGNNDPLQKGALALWNKDIVVVAAAGNSGPNEHTIKSPGTAPKIITVGGLDISKEENIKVADFSSRGPVPSRFKPDLIAPSVEIVGASTKPNLPYIKMSGTSVATPIVAGICAIMLEKNKNLTPDRLKFLLISKCKSINKDKNSEGFGYIKFWLFNFLWYNTFMIEIKNLTYNYDSKFSALYDINLNISKNTVIFADEMSSKTLFRILSKQYTDYTGEIILDKQNIKETKIKDLSISYITNPPYLIKSKPIAYNIAYPLIVRKEDKKQALKRAHNLLQEYNLEDKKIKQCTDFEKAIITLLRAIIRHPKIVLIDDIFTNLNKEQLNIVINVINKISKESLTIISLNQSQNLFNDYEALRLYNGKLED